MVNSGLEVSNSNRITFATHATHKYDSIHRSQLSIAFPESEPKYRSSEIRPSDPYPNQLPSISHKSQYRSSMIRLSNPQSNTVHIPQILILLSMIRLPHPQSNTIHIPQIQILLFNHY